MDMDLDYLLSSFHISTDSGVPLYSQLASYIRFQIQTNMLKPGDMMLPESSICNALSISRSTVRQAMNRLVSEGMLIRYRGRGTYIADQKIRRNINYMYNFTQSMLDANAQPASVVLNCEIITIDDFLAKTFNIMNGSREAFFLRRLRCGNNQPILLETTYIPYYLCNGIEKVDFEHASLYETLSSRYSLNLCHAVETIESIIISGEASKQLLCIGVTPGFQTQRISYLDSGNVFEFTTSTTRADKCIFRLDLYQSRDHSKNSVDFERKINL